MIVTRQVSNPIVKMIGKHPSVDTLEKDPMNQQFVNLLKNVYTPNIINITFLGRGTFGIVFGIETLTNGIHEKIALKIIAMGDFGDNYSYLKGNARKEQQYQQDILDMNQEIVFSYRMGENNIGPKVLNTFHIPITSKQGYQYIFMEAMDTSLATALNSDKLTNNCKQILVHSMITLIKKQLGLNLVCMDQKPGNFVIKFQFDNHPGADSRKCRKHIIRMIDFGADWCTHYLKLTKLETMQITMILIIQIMLIVQKDNPDIYDKVLYPLVIEPVFVEYYTHRDKLVELLQNTYSSDIGATLIHYGFPGEDHKQNYLVQKTLDRLDDIVRNVQIYEYNKHDE